jgi:uncharacterized protein YecE (DUF72 family)
MNAKHATWQPLTPPPDLGPKKIYIGASGYYYDDWVGLFNPPRRRSAPATPDASDDDSRDRLRFYQRYFSFVEINSSYYQMPELPHFADIERRSKESMLYAVKVHKDLSHTKTFDIGQGKELMQRHLVAVSPLVETGRFYSFLIQLEDHLFRTTPVLDYLLAVASEAVKMRIDVHIEFRNKSWHTMNTLQALKDAGVGICNTDLPPIPHAFPLRAYATTDKGYLRYNGRNLENWYPKGTQITPKERIAARNARYDYLYSAMELEELIKGQLELLAKTATIAVAYNNHFRIKAIENAIENLKLLAERVGEQGNK